MSSFLNKSSDSFFLEGVGVGRRKVGQIPSHPFWIRGEFPIAHIPCMYPSAAKIDPIF